MSNITQSTCNDPTFHISAFCDGEYDPAQEASPFYNSVIFFSRVIQARISLDIHPDIVAKQAIERYGVMIESTLKGMAGMLDESELLLMLDANPTPYWRYEVAIDLPSMLVEAVGGTMLAKSSPIFTLADKLARLTTSQQIALTDVMERLWRNMDDEKSLMARAKEAGLLLNEHIYHLDEAA